MRFFFLVLLTLLLSFSQCLSQKNNSKPSFQGNTESTSSKKEKNRKSKKSENKAAKNIRQNLRKYYDSERWGKKMILKTGVGYLETVNYFNKDYEWKNPLLINLLNFDYLFSEKMTMGLGIMLHGDASEYTKDSYRYKMDASNFYLMVNLKQYININIESFRPYVCAGLNYVVSSSDYKQYEIQKNELVFYKNQSDVFAGWIARAGGDFVFNDWLGIFFEGGWGACFVNGGIVLRF